MFFILSLIFLTLFLIFDIKFRINNRNLIKLGNKIPGPKGLPLIGYLHNAVDGPTVFLQLIRKLRAKYDKIFKVWLGYGLYVCVLKPEDIEVILNNSVEKDYYLKFTKIFVGDSIFISPEHTWKSRRKLIQPTFNTKIINSFHQKMAKQSEILCKRLEAKIDSSQYFDCYELLFACTLDILFETNLDHSIGFQKGELPLYVQYATRVMHTVVVWMGQFWLHLFFIFKRTKMGKEFISQIEYMRTISIEIIKRKTAEIKDKIKHRSYSENETQKPFLEHLISAKESGFPISDQSIEYEVNTMIVAGSDTTANVMSYVLMCLGVLQDVQEEVYNEINVVFGDSDRECTLDDIKALHFLEMVIKETMRLFAPVPMLVREITKDIQLPTVTIPANTNCIIGVLELHRSADIYPDPLKFDPKRFLPEEVAKRHPYAYIPFGGGARGCIGTKFAYLSMKIILATILRKYQVYSDVNLEKLDLKMEIFLKPVNGYRIRLAQRNK